MFHASNWTKSTLGVGSTKLQTGSASLPILNLNGKLLSLWYNRGFGKSKCEPMSQLNDPYDALHHPLYWRQHLVFGTVCALEQSLQALGSVQAWLWHKHQ